MSFEHLFRAGSIGGVTLPNRVVVAPMTRISATDNGLATGKMAAYYARYATGGFGLMISEGTFTDERFSQCYPNQPGLATDEQAASWRQVVEAVHAAGGRIFAQLMHGGGVNLYNRYEADRIAPSAVQPPGEQPPRYHGRGSYPVPREITHEQIAEAAAGFAAAAARAADVGFEGVEIHGANGYLIDQFLTVYANQRTDEYGGSLENRMRFAIQVVEAITGDVPTGFPVGIRISQTKVNDLTYAWPGGEDDARTIFGALGKRDLAYIHVSSHLGCDPVFGCDVSLAGLARRYSGKTVIANGKLQDPALADALIARGEADFISIAKGALAERDWPRKVARGEALIPFDPEIISPLADLDNAEAWRARRAEG
jgi:2,4-dienoyl-CoA reductase-like NADH-dependent reductase (Old Yellow Enzyme family)